MGSGFMNQTFLISDSEYLAVSHVKREVGKICTEHPPLIEEKFFVGEKNPLKTDSTSVVSLD